MKPVQRILFVRTDRMGDLLMNLPALRLLRQTFPKAWITLLLDRPLAGLLTDHPDIDELMYVDAKTLHNFLGTWKLSRKIRRAGFDLVVISNPDKFLHLAVFLAGIPQRVGYGRKWGFLLTRRIKDAKAAGARHEMDANLELASLVSDRVWDGSLTLPVDPRAAARVENLLVPVRAGAIIAVHPGTSHPEKRWPLERFSELCDLFQEKKTASVVLVGGPEEAVHAKEVVRKARLPLVDWTGGLTLAELVAFLKNPRVRLLVSSDSGPVHVAWVGGTPVVALYAQNLAGSDPARWGPRNGLSEVIYKPMPQITVAEVYEKACRVLGKEKSRV